ncbi:MAG TPA: hypothetical protein VF376_13385 [Thermoanaerobaculia bacterium]
MARSHWLRRLLGVSAFLLTVPQVVRGQAGVWSTHGPEGASVYCVVPDPSHPATIYAGTGQGVYKSTDGGATWSASGAGMPTAHVQTIIIDPTATNTLYAGTLTPVGAPSQGIFKTTDGAATWSAINNGLIDPISSFSPVDVAVLAFDPSNSKTLLAGTISSEIYKSTDGGATWQAKTNGGFDLGLQVSSIQFNPAAPKTVYAASNNGLLQSTDGGEDWAFYGDSGTPFFAIAIDSTNPSVIYGGDNTGFGMLKSTDGGNHWVQMNNGLPISQGAWPFINTLAIDPTNHSIVYAGTYGGGVFVTNNGAASWSSASSGLRSAYVETFAFEASPSRILAGTLGGGVYQSQDGAQTWTTLDNGLELSLIYEVALDPGTPGTVYAGAFDGVHQSVDGGQTWQLKANGLPVDPVDAIVVVSGSQEKWLAGTLGGGLFKSTDGGATWAASAQGLNDSFIGALFVDPNNSSIVYAGTAHPDASSERVYKSNDGGNTWSQTTLDASVYPIDFLAVNPGNSSQVIAGSNNVAAYFQSTDAGKTWATVNPSSNCGGVNGFLFNPAGSTLYLAGSTGVCRTTDNGKTWNQAAVGTSAVTSLALDPIQSSTLYAGSALNATAYTGAVFRSTDGGQTWAPLGSGFPAASASSLVMDPSGTLRAGTRGAGVALLAILENRETIQPPKPAGRKTRDLPAR